MSNATLHPDSDFGLHTMGSLADGITQGNAPGSAFRTAPLWGLGQRMFFPPRRPDQRSRDRDPGPPRAPARARAWRSATWQT
jgi:hypothetical protein